MINKVLVIADLRRGGQATNAYKLHQLIIPVMKELGVACDVIYSKINLIQNHDDYFQDWKESLFKNDYAHLDALDLNANVSVVGFELPNSDTDYLSSKGISWINIAIHPLRFLSDLHFDVESSFDYNFSNITASLGEIVFCVSNLKLKYGSWIDSSNKSTLVIFGQTPFDKSVYFDNEFTLLDNYLNELDELAFKHEKVVYRPHPWATCATVDALIIERYKAQLSNDVDVYRLFASGEMSTACSISSSVIAEAREFGVTAIYLEPRARLYGLPINYSRLLDDCFFWNSFLNIKPNLSYLPISGSIPDNFLRETFAYWGYSSTQKNLSNDVNLLKESFARNEIQLNEIEGKVQLAQAKAEEAEMRAQEAEMRAQEAEVRAQEAEVRAQEAEAVKLNALHQTDLLRKSNSWKITKPLRYLKRMLS